MISGTDFWIEDPEFITHACRGMRHPVLSVSEIADIRAECEANRAMCLACHDGMVVVDLRPGPSGLELFAWVAIAFRRGAFERQDHAMDNIGRELGARTVAFQSRRRGWGRRLGPEWSRRGADEFVREVRHGG